MSEYDSFISKYINETRSEDANEYREETIKTLKEYVNYAKDYLEQEKQKEKNFTTPLPKHVVDKAGMTISVLAYFLREANQKFVNQLSDYVYETIEVTNILMKKINSDSSIEANYIGFINSMKKKIVHNQKIIKLRFYRDTLAAKIDRIASTYTIGNLIDPIARSMQQAFFQFDSTLNYVKNDDLDQAVSIYLHHSDYSAMLYPISRVVASGDVKSTLISLSELTELVYNDIKIQHPTAKLILYISIVRATFEESYTIFPELNRFAKANASFIENCKKFSRRTVDEISSLLPEKVTKGYTKGLEVRTMFRKKQVGYMKNMEMMLNPIDMMIQIYKSVNAVKQYFMCDAGEISFEETNTLVLILLSIAPPSNTVSIARFLTHWKDLVLVPNLKKYVENFVGAVELLFSFQEVGEEEESA